MIDFKKIFLKNIIPTIFVIAFFEIRFYIITGILVPIHSSTISLFIIGFIATFIFWNLLDYIEEITGIVMKEKWIGGIIFTLGVLALIYLYKVNGKI